MQNNENFAENQNFANAPLIRVELNEEGRQVVSARELHKYLEVQTRFDVWISRMLGYDFKEKRDYVLVDQKRSTNNPKNPFTSQTDYALTISCAKEIAMIQRSEKGKQIHRYFLWCDVKTPKALPAHVGKAFCL